MDKMDRGKVTKKTLNAANTNNETGSFMSMPIELITKIIACVAAYSVIDIFNIKLSCKTLKEVTDSKEVIQHVSLETLLAAQCKSRCQWIESREQALSFLDRCIKNDNSNALYLHGVVQYFDKIETESAKVNLERAADFGHLEAKYVTGIIYILEEDKLKQKGMQIIKELKKSNVKVKVIRKNFLSLLRSYIWVNNTKIVRERKSVTCCITHVQHDGWKAFEDLDLECEECWCDQEICSISKVLLNSNI